MFSVLLVAMYHHLGAHPESGAVRFAVWAPNADDVSVLCDRNHWTAGQNRLLPADDGIWRGHVQEMGVGETYKFGIRARTGENFEKSDPFAFASELRPKTASIVADLDGFEWSDSAWIEARDAKNWLREPISVYEVHLGSWKRPWDGREYHNYREIAPMLVDHVRGLGYTHIELMPITEHPFDGSWGYQTTGMFAPTSRYGSPDDFMFFVNYCHEHGVGVILDWVPAHFPRDGHSLACFDGTACYEHEDPRKGAHPDWGTLIYNYSRLEVKEFLISSAKFWCDKYHIDGLRVDAVASMLYLDYSRPSNEWVPNEFGGRENLEAIEFLRELNIRLHDDYPGILTLAEESTSWGGVSRPVYDGGLGFTMKWDMGWMNDTLRYMRRDPVHRSHHQNDLSFRMVYAFTENFMLPLSHDEVVHGKGALIDQMPGDDWQRFANLRLLYGYQYAMPGKKLLFMGGEFAQWKEWNHEGQLDWELAQHERHTGITNLIADLNKTMVASPALFEGDVLSEGFHWIQCDDHLNSVFAFARTAIDNEEQVVAVLNFTPEVRRGYRIGVDAPGFYREILNTDSERYGGTNQGNSGGVYSEPVASHGREDSLLLTLPPLGMLLLKRV